MSLTSFVRIAILEPALAFSYPETPTFDHRMRGDLAVWLAKAKFRKADACYPRVNAMPTQAALGVMDFIRKELQLIAPAKFHDAGIFAVAFHHRSAEKPMLPPGQYLRGISCHGLEEVRSAEAAGFDYAFLSPVHSTASHPGATALGLEEFRKVCKLSRLPIFALGGMDESKARECLDAGAIGWAGIRAFMT
jgi:Thiamine monophosphate synthase